MKWFPWNSCRDSYNKITENQNQLGASDRMRVFCISSDYPSTERQNWIIIYSVEFNGLHQFRCICFTEWQIRGDVTSYNQGIATDAGVYGIIRSQFGWISLPRVCITDAGTPHIEFAFTLACIIHEIFTLYVIQNFLFFPLPLPHIRIT